MTSKVINVYAYIHSLISKVSGIIVNRHRGEMAERLKAAPC